MRSGQVKAPPGFEYWLLKLDGVSNHTDRDLADPQGFGAIEYACSLMARAAGIRMAECRLFEESGRRHFMPRRFDRLGSGEKLHMQSLAALAHFDFNHPAGHSCQQALTVIRRLGLSMDDIEEQFRRIVLNIIARNQDDHPKNIAFLMDKPGRRRLSPAFDVMYAYHPSGTWTAMHQMSLAGKRDGFTCDDLKTGGQTASMKRGRAEAITREVAAAIRRWREFADQAGVLRDQIEKIGNVHGLDLLPKQQAGTHASDVTCRVGAKAVVQPAQTYPTRYCTSPTARPGQCNSLSRGAGSRGYNPRRL